MTVTEANVALRDARLTMRLSQTELAERIREAGFRNGEGNACTRGMVQRWESGKIRRPQARYVAALETILGQPAASLGFADEAVGLDRGRALSSAGLDEVFPLPDPGVAYGPASGIWRSEYEYPSSSSDDLLASRHYVQVLQRGAQLVVRSVPRSRSGLSMRMEVNGSVVTGLWTERTDASGRYGGALYHGAIQLLADPTWHRMGGKWVGFGRDLAVNVGAWTLELVADSLADDVREKWNRPADEQ
jgi:transcriptional regulator with XRE-family HTH domain